MPWGDPLNEDDTDTVYGVVSDLEAWGVGRLRDLEALEDFWKGISWMKGQFYVSKS